jgi:hypothetical protein
MNNIIEEKKIKAYLSKFLTLKECDFYPPQDNRIIHYKEYRKNDYYEYLHSFSTLVDYLEIYN